MSDDVYYIFLSTDQLRELLERVGPDKTDRYGRTFLIIEALSYGIGNEVRKLMLEDGAMSSNESDMKLLERIKLLMEFSADIDVKIKNEDMPGIKYIKVDKEYITVMDILRYHCRDELFNELFGIMVRGSMTKPAK